MKVILAGYNYDMQYGDKIRTPETISASYARISRSVKPVNELRKEACSEVSKARKSNETIIFGLGHASVAEHAVFNFDIIGLSRLATEFVQHHRLASFTEKSQRYVKFSNFFHVPAEIEKHAGLKKEYTEFSKSCFALYKDIIDECSKMGMEKTTVNEDARYVLPLSTLTQFGMTVNARELEHMISSLNSQNLLEGRAIADALYRKAHKLAPSLIKYTRSRPVLERTLNMPAGSSAAIKLLQYSRNQADAVISAYMFARGLEYNKKDKAKRDRIVKDILKSLQVWDRPPREFELVDFTFAIPMSGSAFAQLKRHRMATIIEQGYDLSAGPVVPAAVRDAGFLEKMLELHEKSACLALKLALKGALLPYYAGLNGSKKTVIMKINGRELYHFSRLRADKHAQWEIRDIAFHIMNTVQKKEPLLYSMLCGKDQFPKK